MAMNSDKVAALANIPLFSACSKRELGQIARIGDEIRVAAGHTLAAQGQMGREAFVIFDGTVDVKRGGRKVATLEAGEVVGELSLLDHGPRTATIETATDCELFVLDQRHFRGMLSDHPSIALKLLGALAARIRDFDRKYYG